MSNCPITSSRHDDQSSWGSRTLSAPELIPEVSELGLVGPLVNPESTPVDRALVSQGIIHNILLVNVKKKDKNEEEKSVCIEQFLNCRGELPCFTFFSPFFVFSS